MGAQKAAVKATQEDSMSKLNAFYFLLLCPRIQVQFPKLMSDLGLGPSKK